MPKSVVSGAPDLAAVREIAAGLADLPGALLPILHALQDRFGFIHRETIPVVAEVLNLSRAEVHGVVSFYHFFRESAPGERVVYLCRAEACQSMGARELEAHARERLGVDFHETTADGRVSFEPVYCLGNCACAPSIMIDEAVHGRVTPQLFDELIAQRGEPA